MKHPQVHAKNEGTEARYGKEKVTVISRDNLLFL